jgi:general stress protein 26
MKLKLFFLTLFGSALWLSDHILTVWIQPHLATSSSLNAAKGSSIDFVFASALATLFNTVNAILGLLSLALLFLVIVSILRGIYRRRKSTKLVPLSLVALTAVGLASCKPYDKPEYLQVANNETAFVIPLEDAKEKVDSQVRFNSEEFLNQAKVLTKRIQVTHRWQQTGRLWFDGAWMPMVAVLKVDRSPVTREWNSSSASQKGKDQAIWIESADSVGFCMGVSCTAYIKEEDSAKFLYMYPSGSLQSVMDSEIRARIQKIAAEAAAMLPLDQLREKKSDIMKALDSDLVPFFAQRGISITTIGMFGGMTYENPKIQLAIDEVFVAQQKKNVALAEFEAQAKTNERVLLSAKADAEQITMKATAEAERKTLEAEAEAKAITVVNQSLTNTNPTFIQLRVLETQQKQYDRWDGRFPTTFMGGLSTPNLLLNVPSPTQFK